jgi:hypothetical protein
VLYFSAFPLDRSNLVSAAAASRLPAAERALRRDRIFAKLLDGQSIAVIAAEESVTPRRVRQIIEQALQQWDADPVQDYVGMQIARLEPALRLIEQKIAAGDVTVVDKLIKVLGQLDKYHEGQLAPRDDEYHDAAVVGRLERLAASRAVVAARLAKADAAAQGPEPPRRELLPAPESSEVKENVPQVIENAQNEEIPAFPT